MGEPQEVTFETVWQRIREIPKGSVMTYKGIAETLGTHHRVVARAVRESPTDVPWWRVVNEGWQVNRYDKLPPEMLLIQVGLLRWEGVWIDMSIPRKHRLEP